MLGRRLAPCVHWANTIQVTVRHRLLLVCRACRARMVLWLARVVLTHVWLVLAASTALLVVRRPVLYVLLVLLVLQGNRLAVHLRRAHTPPQGCQLVCLVQGGLTARCQHLRAVLFAARVVLVNSVLLVRLLVHSALPALSHMSMALLCARCVHWAHTAQLPDQQHH